jgi:hypothetical protein
MRGYIPGCILRRYFDHSALVQAGIRSNESIYILSNVKNTSALPMCDDIFGRDVKNTVTFDSWECSYREAAISISMAI